MNVAGFECDNPVMVANTPLMDIDDSIDAQAIGTLWKYFRLNNPTSLSRYPDVAHIQLQISDADLLKYRDVYRQIFEPLFLVFIQGDGPVRQMIWVTNRINEDAYLIYRSGGVFTTALIDIPTQMRLALTDHFQKLSRENGYYGHWVEAGVYDCGPPRTIMSRLASYVQGVMELSDPTSLGF